MRRLLIDLKKLDQKAASLLRSTYPHGFGDDDIISFKNGNGEIIQAVELRTDAILYLVKIGTNTSHFIMHEDLQEENARSQDEVAIPDAELELDMEKEAEEQPGGEEF